MRLQTFRHPSKPRWSFNAVLNHAFEDNCRKSQAFAKAHSRSTVADDIPSACRRFVDREPREESQLHDPALP